MVGIKVDLVDCGLFGSYNVSDQACICDETWVQTLDWVVFVSEDQELTIPCFENLNISLAFYGYQLFMTIFSFIYIIVEYRRREPRQKALILRIFFATTAAMIFSFHKVFSHGSANFGHDFLYTYEVLTALMFASLAGLSFENRYLEYIEACLRKFNQMTTWRTLRFQLQYMWVGLDVLLLQSSAFISLVNSAQLRTLLFRIAFGIVVVRMVYHAYLIIAMYRYFIRDLDILLSLNNRLGGSIVWQSDQDVQHLAQIQRMKIASKKTRTSLLSAMVICIIMFIPCLVTDYGFLVLMYIAPLIGTMILVVTFRIRYLDFKVTEKSLQSSSTKNHETDMNHSRKGNRPTVVVSRQMSVTVAEDTRKSTILYQRGTRITNTAIVTNESPKRGLLPIPVQGEPQQADQDPSL